MPRVFFSIAIIAALAASAAPALSAAALDGWGAYKFGLSPDQARAVPGQTFGPYSAKNLMNDNIGSMGSKNDAMVNGLPYDLNLIFNPPQKLSEISLANEKTGSQADCEKTFLTVLSQLEKTYGNLSPVNPQRQKNDQQTPPTSLVWKNSAGASHYQLSTVFLDDETAYVWNARKVVNGKYVDLATSWSSSKDESHAPCLTEMDYRG